jgi:hypothetical protein
MEKIVHNIPSEPQAKIGNFWSKLRHPFCIFKVEPVLDKLEKIKTAWGPPASFTVQIETPRPHRAPSDSGGRRLARTHGFARRFHRHAALGHRFMRL